MGLTTGTLKANTTNFALDVGSNTLTLVSSVDGSYVITFVRPGVISGATVSPASLVVNASGNATVAFTMESSLPKDGKVVVTFPAGFDLATAAPAASSAADINGTFVTTVDGQVVTITRQDDGTDTAAGAITDLTLSNIKNPGEVGDTGTFIITTKDASDNTIDTVNTVPKVIITN